MTINLDKMSVQEVLDYVKTCSLAISKQTNEAFLVLEVVDDHYIELLGVAKPHDECQLYGKDIEDADWLFVPRENLQILALAAINANI